MVRNSLSMAVDEARLAPSAWLPTTVDARHQDSRDVFWRGTKSQERPIWCRPLPYSSERRQLDRRGRACYEPASGMR